MKVIKVDSCRNCPYLSYEASGREHFYCEKSCKTLAREGQTSLTEAEFNSLTMMVTPEKLKWTYLLPDEKTEWDDSTIPDWCPLEDQKYEIY